MVRGCLILLLVLALVHASARTAPSDDQKNFLPTCPPKAFSNNALSNEQVFVHATAPVAESPTSITGLKDKKNFIYGGVGGFAGMGGYAGMVGDFPILGGLGGIGGVGGIGGNSGLGTGGGVGGIVGGAAGGAGGMFPCP